MILGVYAIRDSKTGFLTPTVDQNDAAAKRNFEHAMMNEQSLFFSHPEDYSLYKIATYDTEQGIMTPMMEKVLIMDALGYGDAVGVGKE